MPEVCAGPVRPGTLAQVFLLIATLAYALSTLIARGAPPMDAIAFAASYATVSAGASLPLALTVTVAGENAKFLMCTASVATAADALAAPPAPWAAMSRR